VTNPQSLTGARGTGLAERLIREREMRRTSSVLSFEGGNPVEGTSTSSAQGSPKGVGPERMRRASENPSQMRVRATHFYEDIRSPVVRHFTPLVVPSSFC